MTTQQKVFLTLICVCMTSIAINVAFFIQHNHVMGDNKALEDWKKEATHKMDSLDDAAKAWADTVNNDRAAAEQIIIQDKPIRDVQTFNRSLPPDSVESAIARHYPH